MRYCEVAPHPKLASYIAAYWLIALDDHNSLVTQEVLPDLCSDLIFDVGSTPFRPFGKSDSKIIGVMTTAQRPHLDLGNKLVGVRFQPHGAAAVFGFHARDLMDETSDLKYVGKADFDVCELLYNCQSPAEQFGILDHLFASKMEHFRPVRPLLNEAVKTISGSGGNVSVSDLAHSLGCTNRHLSRIFTEEIGLTPKQFVRIERVRTVVHSINASRRQPDWSSVALTHGYFDQAHLCEDFSKIVGISPNRYWKNKANALCSDESK